MERMTSSEIGRSAPLVEALILPGSIFFRWCVIIAGFTDSPREPPLELITHVSVRLFSL